MKIDNVKSFAERVSVDPALESEVAEASTAEKIVALAKRLGFDFTVEDLRAFYGNLQLVAGAISADELEQVAGGAILNASDEDDIPLTEPKTCGTPCCQVETAFRRLR